jgi:hypothetical protein
MNVLSYQKHHSSQWSIVVFLTLCFWLSASLVLDLVIMPSLMSAGMMSQSGFASAGYSMFGLFNHIELLCGGLVLTGVLILNKDNQLLGKKQQQWSILLSSVLLGSAMICSYVLTPEMSGWGLSLNWFESEPLMSAEMMELHTGYWGLELLKFCLGGILLVWNFRLAKSQELN